MSYFLWVVLLLLLQVNEGANDAATMGRQQVLQYGQGHHNLLGSQSARTWLNAARWEGARTPCWWEKALLGFVGNLLRSSSWHVLEHPFVFYS